MEPQKLELIGTPKKEIVHGHGVTEYELTLLVINGEPGSEEVSLVDFCKANSEKLSIELEALVSGSKIVFKGQIKKALEYLDGLSGKKVWKITLEGYTSYYLECRVLIREARATERPRVETQGKTGVSATQLTTMEARVLELSERLRASGATASQLARSAAMAAKNLKEFRFIVVGDITNYDNLRLNNVVAEPEHSKPSFSGRNGNKGKNRRNW